MVVGNIVIKECKPLYTPLLENRNTTTKQDGTVVVFSDSTKTISIGQDSIFDQRGSPEYYIEDLVRMSNGIFFCVDGITDSEKRLIEYTKHVLEVVSPFDSYLMVLEYSQLVWLPKSKLLSKEKVKIDGVETIKSNEINTALDKMLQALENKKIRYQNIYLMLMNLSVMSMIRKMCKLTFLHLIL